MLVKHVFAFHQVQTTYLSALVAVRATTMDVEPTPTLPLPMGSTAEASLDILGNAALHVDQS